MQKETNFGDSGLRYESHPSLSYRAIYYGENCPHERRLLCVECMIEFKKRIILFHFKR